MVRAFNMPSLMDNNEEHDHKLCVNELLMKYGITQVNKKANLTVHSAHIDKTRKRENMIFPHRDHALIQLIVTTLLEPVNILSFFSASALVVIYIFNREEKQHLLVFFFTAAIIVAKTAVKVHEESKINAFYRRKIDSYHARIIENNQITQISKEFVSVGDILDLRKGDIVAADSVLFRANNLVVDTSTLSGSHRMVKKRIRVSDGKFSEADNVVLEGHRIISGRGKAVVVRIGKNTMLGQMYNKFVYRKDITSALFSEMNVFFYGSMIFALLLCCVLAVPAAIYDMTFANVFSLIVSIFIAITPEGIASTVKLLLFSAVSKLDAKSISIKDVGAIEKLGLVTMVVAERQALMTSNCKICNSIFDGETMIDVELAFHDKDERSLRVLERIGHVSGMVSMNRSSRKSYCTSLEIFSDLCNRYFVGFTRMSSKIKDVKMRNLHGTIVNDTKFKSIHIAGDVESILRVCNKYRKDGKVAKLTSERRNKILRICRKMKVQGNEAIALATRSYGLREEKVNLKGLVFECSYFLEEKPAMGALMAADIFKASGIGFSILTNITEEANLNSSREIIGIGQGCPREYNSLALNEDDRHKVVSSEDYKKWSISDKMRFLSSRNFIVYGCDLDHKADIVRDLQDRGHVVSFVGSEIDDCGALNRSDFGVCFDDSGQMCKEASSVVLQSQKFESIVYGIEEGRLFFVNLQKSIRYILMHVTPQIIPFALYALVGTPLPLSPILLIFLNYLIEVIPAKFFAYEEPEYNLMVERPINIGDLEGGVEHAFASDRLSSLRQPSAFVTKIRKMTKSGIYSANNISWPVLEAGLISGFGCMLAFYMVLYQHGVPVSKMFFSAPRYFLYNSPDLELRNNTEIGYEAQIDIVFEGQSTFFVGLVICQLCNMLVCRREREYFFYKFFNNPRILIFSLIGTVVSVSIVFLGFFDEFLLVRCPALLPLIAPTISATLIMALDTFRKYRTKHYK